MFLTEVFILERINNVEMAIILSIVFISKRKLSNPADLNQKWTVCMQQADILFPEKHSTIYF